MTAVIHLMDLNEPQRGCLISQNHLVANSGYRQALLLFPFQDLTKKGSKQLEEQTTKNIMEQAPNYFEHQIVFLTLFSNSEKVISLSTISSNTLLKLYALYFPNNTMTYSKIISQHLLFLSLEDVRTKMKLR